MCFSIKGKYFKFTIAKLLDKYYAHEKIKNVQLKIKYWKLYIVIKIRVQELREIIMVRYHMSDYITQNITRLSTFGQKPVILTIHSLVEFINVNKQFLLLVLLFKFRLGHGEHKLLPSGSCVMACVK